MMRISCCYTWNGFPCTLEAFHEGDHPILLPKAKQCRRKGRWPKFGKGRTKTWVCQHPIGHTHEYGCSPALPTMAAGSEAT